jgi:hypothetical protein
METVGMNVELFVLSQNGIDVGLISSVEDRLWCR